MYNFFTILISALLIIGCNSDEKGKREDKVVTTVTTITTERDCKCPLEKDEGNQTGLNQSKTKEEYGGSIDASVEGLAKKFIEGKISGSGKYNYSSTDIEKYANEISNTNPALTQTANLYRNIACALYSLICNDPSLTTSQVNSYSKSIIEDYKKNVDRLVKTKSEPFEEPAPKPVVKSNDSPSKPVQYNRQNCTKEGYSIDKDGFSNIREKATKHSAIIDEVKTSEPFCVLATSGNWVKIKTQRGKIGFIYSELIKYK